jgi:hypothetical protein
VSTKRKRKRFQRSRAWQRVMLTFPPSVSRLSRHCGILNISQLHRPPRPVMGRALLLLFTEYSLYKTLGVSRLSVQTNLTVSSNLRYYVQKQVQLLRLLSMKTFIAFLQFLYKVFAVIFCYLISSALLMSLYYHFICALSIFFLYGYRLLH